MEPEQRARYASENDDLYNDASAAPPPPMYTPSSKVDVPGETTGHSFTSIGEFSIPMLT